MRPVGRLALVTASDVGDACDRVHTALDLAMEALVRCGEGTPERTAVRGIIDELLPAVAMLESWRAQLVASRKGGSGDGR